MPTTTIIASEEAFAPVFVSKENHYYPEIIPSEELVFFPTLKQDQTIELRFVDRFIVDEITLDFLSGSSSYEVQLSYNGMGGEFLHLEPRGSISFPENYSLVGSFNIGLSINSGPYLLLSKENNLEGFYSPIIGAPDYIPDNTDVMTYEPVSLETGEEVFIPSTSNWIIQDTPITLTTGDSLSVRLFFSDVSDAQAVSISIGDGDSTVVADGTTYTDTSTPWSYCVYDESLMSEEEVYVASFAPHTDFISSAENIFTADIEADYSITTSGIIDDGTVYIPIRPITGTNIITSFVTDFTLATEADDAISTDVGDLISVVNENLTFADSIYEPTIVSGQREIRPSIIPSEEYLFPGIFVEAPQDSALVALFADQTGNVTSNRVAPRLNYYSVQTTDDIVYTSARSLFPDYIKAEDSLFEKVFYSAFYVRNASQSTNRTQSFISIDGGTTFKFDTPTETVERVYESDYYLDQILNTPGLNFSGSLDYYRERGSSQTSLFGQIEIDINVGNKNEIIKRDLTGRNYRPGYEKLPMPDLKSREFVPVYLRAKVKFDPNLGIPIDYSFLHINYSNGSFIENYPGQAYDASSGTYVMSQTLPSIAIPFITNYERFIKLIDDTTDELYDKYPPFFLDYRDL